MVKFDIYFLVCFVFCIYTLHILINNGRKTVYRTNQYQVNFTYVSLCIELVDYDCSLVNSDDTTQACYKLANLTEFFKQNTTPQKIIQKAKGYGLASFFTFDERKVRRVFYYLNFRSICLAYEVEMTPKEDEFDYANIRLRNTYKVESKILLHSERPVPFITRGYHFECENFVYCGPFTISIKRFKLILLPKPFSSDCRNYSEMSFSFRKFEAITSRSYCIAECLKHTIRLSRFYYSENDTEVLKFSRNFKAIDSVKREYLNCLKICESLDCEAQNYFVNGFSFGLNKEFKFLNNQSLALIRHHHREMVYEAIPVSSSFKLLPTSFLKADFKLISCVFFCFSTS